MRRNFLILFSVLFHASRGLSGSSYLGPGQRRAWAWLCVVVFVFVVLEKVMMMMIEGGGRHGLCTNTGVEEEGGE